MLKEMGTGLLVTELMGQGVNIVNGDYSRGAAGFWVENGGSSIRWRITIAGNPGRHVPAISWRWVVMRMSVPASRPAPYWSSR